jgi:hypothetical protein
VGLGSGCGVKLFYNNVDRLAHWTMDDYMRNSTRRSKRSSMPSSTCCCIGTAPRSCLYAKTLLEFDNPVADGASVEEMFVLRGDVEDWWKAIQKPACPRQRN